MGGFFATWVVGSDFSLELFSNIIQEFSLDVDQIKKLNENYPEIKFPSEDR